MGYEMQNKKWRFIQTGFSSPYENMAIDEAMLLEYSNGHILPTLRIYGWKPAGFSLGYFQDPKKELNINKCNQENIGFVRRMTGGGIIFHNQELTYSLVCCQKDIGEKHSVKESFKIICRFLINAYKKLGVDACFAVDNKKENEKLGNFSGFCFASKEEYDIVVGGKKLGGNAQRRKKDIIFQHGSIPLQFDINAVSPFLKKDLGVIDNNICSLKDVLGKEMDFNYLKDIIKKSFKETFSVDLSEESLNPEEKQIAKKLEKEKYTGNDWNLYRKDKSDKNFIYS